MLTGKEISNQNSLFQSLEWDLSNIQRTAENKEKLYPQSSFISYFKGFYAYTVNDLALFKRKIEATKSTVLTTKAITLEHANKKKEAFSRLLELDFHVLDALKEKRKNLHPFVTPMQHLRYVSLVFSFIFGVGLLFAFALFGSPFALLMGALSLTAYTIQMYDHLKEKKDLDIMIAEFEKDKLFWEEFKKGLDNPNQDWIKNTLQALNEKKGKLEGHTSSDKNLALTVLGVLFFLPITIVVFSIGFPFFSLFSGVLAVFCMSRMFYRNAEAQKAIEMQETANNIVMVIEALESLKSSTLAPAPGIAVIVDNNDKKSEKSHEPVKLDQGISVAPLYTRPLMQPSTLDQGAVSSMVVNSTLTEAQLSQIEQMSNLGFIVSPKVDVLEMKTIEEKKEQENQDLINFDDDSAPSAVQETHQRPGQSQGENQTVNNNNTQFQL